MSDNDKSNGAGKTAAGLPTPPGAADSSAPRPQAAGGAPSDSRESGSFPGFDTPTDRYEILSEIGRGGMGLVYKARDRETDEQVALKVLKPELAADPALLERFVNELRLARKITHKNVCRIHDLGRARGSICISMEFVEGESLRQVLRRFGSMSLRKALDITRQICAGLAEAHSQGVIHRDLKPENVMLDGAGNVKLMDFGIARSVEPDTGEVQNTTAMGTPTYMSPEQFRREPLDRRSDLYAVGLILYEMLAGDPAFTGESTVALLLKHLHEPPTRLSAALPELPPHIEAIILKCLEKDPAQRFQSAEELAAALDAPSSVAPRPKQRSRLALVAGAITLVALAAAFWLGRMTKPQAVPISSSQPADISSSAAPNQAGSQAAAVPGTTSSGSPAVEPTTPLTATPKQQPPQKALTATTRYDFDLKESPALTIVGPVKMRLNKTDPRRQLYTMTVAMLEHGVEMRDRALLEPVRFYHDPSGLMLEMVVSKIEDGRVQGYLIAPRSLKPLKPAAENGAAPSSTKRPLLSRLIGR